MDVLYYFLQSRHVLQCCFGEQCFNLLICRQHPEKHPFFPTFMHLSDVSVKYFVEAYVAHNDQSFLRRLDFIYTHSTLAAPVHQWVQ